MIHLKNHFHFSYNSADIPLGVVVKELCTSLGIIEQFSYIFDLFFCYLWFSFSVCQSPSRGHKL